MRAERLAIVVLILILGGLPASALGYQFVLRPLMADVRTIDIVAAAPEAGGFQPENIRVAAGETVRLRFEVPDVTHGIAIGPGLDLDLGHVDPGEVKEVEVAFDAPGRYTFYCNTWCSPNHWRMRGTIEVYDPSNPDALIVNRSPDEVFDGLLARNVDIDAPHEATVLPDGRVSAARGADVLQRLDSALPPTLSDRNWRRSHSPVDAWRLLVEAGLSDGEAWDAVAQLWLAEVDPEQLHRASVLYAKNCAACHGEAGDGRGPGADMLASQAAEHDNSMHHDGQPTAFAEPHTMLGGTSEIYYAKLRRGGMGTSMPSFGPIFTRDETWALVAYLWSFVFED